jgi:hypothetical protein
MRLFLAAVIFLGNIPALVFLLLFVLSVFSFAAIYDSLPSRSFYHSTSKFEHSTLDEQADEVLGLIRDAVIQNFIEQYTSPTKTIDGWVVNIEDLKVHSLNVSNYPKEVVFGLRLPIPRENKEGLYYFVDTFVINMGDFIVTNGNYYFFAEPKNWKNKFRNAISPPPPELKELFPNFERGFNKNLINFPMPINTRDEIVKFGEAYRGFPDQIIGSFNRMLYFSAGVATSTTFGDIVPLTDHARTLVALQSILAIILIGLFMNSLALTLTGLNNENA